MSSTKNLVTTKKDINDIISAVGGLGNIEAVTHCVTRLRFILKSEDKVNVKELESIDIVKGSFSSNGQFQVIIGPGLVNKVYDLLIKETGLQESTKEEVKKASAKKLNPLQQLIKVLADNDVIRVEEASNQPKKTIVCDDGSKRRQRLLHIRKEFLD